MEFTGIFIQDPDESFTGRFFNTIEFNRYALTTIILSEAFSGVADQDTKNWFFMSIDIYRTSFLESISLKLVFQQYRI